jgi:hypothetical protein
VVIGVGGAVSRQNLRRSPGGGKCAIPVAP